MSEQKSVGMSGGRKRTLEANIIRACAKCGAPGYWHNVSPEINPGCYAPEKVTQLGQDPVGMACPNCGASRHAIEPRGVIWSLDATLNWFELLIVKTIRKLTHILTPQHR